jgi:uncharacterized protein DUF3309
MSRVGIILLVIIVIALFGGLGVGERWGVPYGYGAGYYGMGGLGTIFIIILILALLGYV